MVKENALEAAKKIKMLVIPSDRTGVGKFRSVDPHVYIAEHYKDEFDIDVVYNLRKENLDKYLDINILPL